MTHEKIVENLSDMIVDKIIAGSTKSTKELAEECITQMLDEVSGAYKEYMQNTDYYIDMFCDMLVKKYS